MTLSTMSLSTRISRALRASAVFFAPSARTFSRTCRVSFLTMISMPFRFLPSNFEINSWLFMHRAALR